MFRFRISHLFERTIALLFFLVTGIAAYQISNRLDDLGVVFSLQTFWWPVLICLISIAIMGFMYIWTPGFPGLVSRLSGFQPANWQNYGLILWIIFLTMELGFSAWVMFKGHEVLDGYFILLFMYLVVSVIGMILIRPLTPNQNWFYALAGSLLITAAIFRGMAFVSDISASPFSLGWSEGSRYYYGSLYFSQRLYGQDIPLSPLHPSRYMLLSLPFIFHGLPIWAHRFWQVFLWIGTAGLAAVTLSNRLKVINSVLFFSFSSWIFLYLNLGPVYYHLLLCVILIYWGVDFHKPIQTLLILIVASIWAGLSRMNWIPVPLFLVLTLYFFECPWQHTKKRWKYLVQPVAWSTIGLITAFLAFRGYILLSGNVPGKFSSSFTSDLIWNRLWPNSTFQMGILPGSMKISLHNDSH